MIHIVKRKGHKQEFDERKVYASVYAACLNAQMSEQETELLAAEVSKRISEWIKEQKEVTSDAIFKKIGEDLKSLNKNAAFMYTTHRDIS